MKKLFIDVGHSNRFPGASGFKKEIVWNRDVLKHLVPLIDRKKWNVQLVPTDFANDTSSNTQLIHRINWINRLGSPSDHLISLHGNGNKSPKPRGVYTCYMGGYESARQAAIALSKSYALFTGIPLARDGSYDDRLGTYGRIGMVRDTDPIALLIEMGFVSNEEDMKADAKKAAQGIAAYYNNL